jgi:aminocarboxymuconate-semialdehyde decarboxylase
MAGKAKSPKERKSPIKGGGRRPFAIDVHTHIRIPALLDFVARNPIKARGPGTEDWFSTSSVANLHEQDRDKARWARLTDAKTRLREMNRRGVDIQVVSSNFPVSCYWMDGRKGLKAARISNDGVAEFVAANPDRFAGLGSVALQNPKSAAGELERCVKDLGLRGAWLASNIRGKDLGEKQFRPFWAKAEALGVPIFIHPLGTTDISRLKKYFLFNTIGQPFEETMAISSLIHEGVMDAYPKLKVVICHGGGYLPYYAARGDRAFRVNAEVRTNIKHPPSAYLRKFFYDCIVFDPDILVNLTRKSGIGKVLMGSDYPLVRDDAVAFIRGNRKLSRDARERILWKNAARLLKIPV